MKQILFTLGVACAIFATSCKKTEVGHSDTSVSQEVLQNVSKNVIIPTYKELNTKAMELKTAVEAFQKDGSEEMLGKARDAWRATRVPWEQSEAFLWGPTGDQGLDPALDSWPVNVEDMNTIINSDKPITEATIVASNETRGFHLIEYLLWGQEGNKTAEQITAREKEYLVAAAMDLASNTAKLVEQWTPYAITLADAGKEDNKKYPSTKAGIQELVQGMFEIANEVASTKIEEPLNGQADNSDGTAHPEFEESRFSHNSKTDYVNNIESIYNVFKGEFAGKQGKGIYDLLVSLQKKELADKILGQIKMAQKAINEIPGTFSDAILNNREKVKEAQNEVKKLHEMLENELSTLVADPKVNI